MAQQDDGVSLMAWTPRSYHFIENDCGADNETDFGGLIYINLAMRKPILNSRRESKRNCKAECE